MIRVAVRVTKGVVRNAGREVVVRAVVLPVPAVRAMISRRVVPWPERGNMGLAWRERPEGSTTSAETPPLVR